MFLSKETFASFPSEQVVLSSTEKHFPVVKQSILQLQISESKLLAAKGLFDTKLKSDNYLVPRGYFTRRYWDVHIEKPLRFANSSVYAGYSNGYSGLWPDQYSTQTTNIGGAPRVGGKFSLLRGLSIDENRAKLYNAKLGLERSKADTQYTLIQAMRDAKVVYWNWISAIRTYHVYKNLLGLAESRKEVLDQRVKAGDISEVVAKENLQYVARRKADLAAAELGVKVTSLDLSLFYRNDKGEPEVLDFNFEEEMENSMVMRTDQITEEAMKGSLKILDLARINLRPDVYALSKELEISQINLNLAENSYIPKFDIGFDYTRNLGYQNPTNAPHVWTVFLNIEIPLEYNFIKGQVRTSQAEKKIIESKYKYQVESAKVEIDKIKESLRLSEESMKNAKEEMTYAKELLVSENYKFSKGGSNFFLINIREEAQAEAQQKYILSQLNYIRSHADYEISNSQFENNKSYTE